MLEPRAKIRQIVELRFQKWVPKMGLFQTETVILGGIKVFINSKLKSQKW